MSRIVLVGEGMVELSRGDGPAAWRLGHGGDTLNTAIHLARLGQDVAFFTAIGDDPFSRDLRLAWTREGIDSALILTDPARRAGLYAITNDPDGERHFTYWRSDSAARRLFELPGVDAAIGVAAQADLLIFSMISLAILPPAGRDALLDLARRVRINGGRVALDTNYRPTLWPDAAEARAVYASALAVADIGLPTMEDEVALASTRDPGSILDSWRSAGVGEVTIKQGAVGCIADGVLVPVEPLTPCDTSGAGDAFNAGYLHARLAGEPPHVAALAGHRLAGWVVMNRGALPAITADAPYAALVRMPSKPG